MLRPRHAALLPLLLAGGLLFAPATAQVSDSQQNLPLPVPPPPPPRPEPEEGGPAREYESIAPESDRPWGLDGELIQSLYRNAQRYLDYSRRFNCDEIVRVADYDGQGEVSGEKVRRYDYLIVSDATGTSVRESRREIAKSGERRPGDIDDAEPFPPAYAWVFLFSRFNEPYFSFRQLDKRFDGFDLVYEIQFKGSLSFTDGRDIRQWEGTVLVDAFRHIPLEIHAEPAGQKERIEALYRQWAQSFNIMGFRTRKPPLGYRAEVKFRYVREGLTFPTELRYDTFKAVSPTHVVAVQASTRRYEQYRFIRVETTEEPGEVVGP